jgi:transcriptional regulator with XRE-family HTH domain
MAGNQRTPLGRLLQQRREERGYSRTRLGELVGVKPGTLEGWELGRVAKPPIHDVLRVARFLGITAAEIEEAVVGASAPPQPGRVPAVAPLLLEQAIELFGWSDEEAAAAFQTTPARVRAWLTGAEPLGLPELMTLTALIGLHAAGANERSRILELAEELEESTRLPQ